MAQSATTQNIEVAASAVIAVPFVLDGTTYYPQLAEAATEVGGCTGYYLSAAATTNTTSVKATAGQLYGFYCSNVHSAPYYLKFYNKASAPTVGTDTVVHCFEIPQAGTAADGYVTTMLFPKGLPFSTGIAFAVTADFSDTGTTAVTASTLKINLFYK